MTGTDFLMILEIFGCITLSAVICLFALIIAIWLVNRLEELLDNRKIEYFWIDKKTGRSRKVSKREFKRLQKEKGEQSK